MRVCLLCFFFQAEDGIRDLYVTGVQTCALPISKVLCSVSLCPARTIRSSWPSRSEERRVGKSVDLGGRRIIKKKKRKKRMKNRKHPMKRSLTINSVSGRMAA